MLFTVSVAWNPPPLYRWQQRLGSIWMDGRTCLSQGFAQCARTLLTQRVEPSSRTDYWKDWEKTSSIQLHDKPVADNVREPCQSRKSKTIMFIIAVLCHSASLTLYFAIMKYETMSTLLAAGCRAKTANFIRQLEVRRAHTAGWIICDFAQHIVLSADWLAGLVIVSLGETESLKKGGTQLAGTARDLFLRRFDFCPIEIRFIFQPFSFILSPLW